MAKTRLIPAGGTAGQVLSKVDGDDYDVQWAASGGGGSSGMLFELDTTVTTDLNSSTDVEGEAGATAGAPVGTLTVTGDVASDWMPSQKVLTLTTDGTFYGLLARRLLCGTLPAAGYILDIGLGGVTGGATNFGLILIGYQPGGAADEPTGLGIYIGDGSSDATIMAIGDDGSGAPHTPTYVAAGAVFDVGTPTALTGGPWRLIVEFRKVDAASPAQWTIRGVTYVGNGAVRSAIRSGEDYPDGGFSTPVTLDGFTPSRIALGGWNQGVAAALSFAVSHLRIYSLGSPVPA